MQVTPEQLEQHLHGQNPLSRAGDYFTLRGRESLVALRQERAHHASRLWAQAIAYGRVIAALPFVRLVAVTGALARNNVEPDADIDYMIVTEPGRLWLSRAMILLVARLARRQRAILCPNYLVTLETLDFPDRTLYAAYEVAQMVPLSGMETYARIRRQNAWVDAYLPNAGGPPGGAPDGLPREAAPLLRRAAETVLRTAPFTALERWEMERKTSRLRCEQAASPESVFSAGCCKGHVHQHQFHTQAAWAERIASLSREVAE